MDSAVAADSGGIEMQRGIGSLRAPGLEPSGERLGPLLDHLVLEHLAQGRGQPLWAEARPRNLWRTEPEGRHALRPSRAGRRGVARRSGALPRELRWWWCRRRRGGRSRPCAGRAARARASRSRARLPGAAAARARPNLRRRARGSRRARPRARKGLSSRPRRCPSCCRSRGTRAAGPSRGRTRASAGDRDRRTDAGSRSP